MDGPPIPQFCLDFLLAQALRYISLSSKPEHVVRLTIYTHYSMQIILLLNGLHYM